MKNSILLSLTILTASANVTLNAAAPHPCIAFAEGLKEAGYAAKLIELWACALSTLPTSLADKIAVIMYPLAHNISHFEAEQAGLNQDPIFRWLASNWTTLGIASTVAMLAKTYGWTEQQTISAIIKALYMQVALTVLTARAGIDSEVSSTDDTGDLAITVYN